MAPDPARTEALVERLTPALLGYFTRRTTDPADAADLVGETFLVLWRRADAVPADPDEARLWAFGVARRVLATARRSGVRRTALAARLRNELSVAHDPAPVDPRVARLSAALAELDDLDREIVRLVHWDGLTQAEVARLLGRRAATVRSRYSRARERLRRELADEQSAARPRSAGR